MDDNDQTVRWQRRDSKKRGKKRFSSDNRRSVRWLYWNSGKKADKEHSNADTSSDML